MKSARNTSNGSGRHASILSDPDSTLDSLGEAFKQLTGDCITVPELSASTSSRDKKLDPSFYRMSLNLRPQPRNVITLLQLQYLRCLLIQALDRSSLTGGRLINRKPRKLSLDLLPQAQLDRKPMKHS